MLALKPVNENAFLGDLILGVVDAWKSGFCPCSLDPMQMENLEVATAKSGRKGRGQERGGTRVPFDWVVPGPRAWGPKRLGVR